MPLGGVSLPAVWPPAGILVGTLVLTDRRQWSPLLAAAAGAVLLSAALHQQPLIPAAGLALISVCEAAVAAWCVQRAVQGPFALDRVTHAATLIFFAIAAPLAGGILAAAVLTAAGASSFVIAWRSWALADALGMLATAPLAITAVTERTRVLALARSWKALEFAVVFAGTIAVAAIIFSDTVDPVFRVPAYVLPFLLWPAFRFGHGGTAATILAVSLIGLWNSAQGQGPLALADVPGMNIVLRSQGAMAVAATSLLLLASVVAERTRVAQENTVLVAELQQALVEVRTLRGFIPICAWCHKVRDDAGFWQQIELYLDARTDATFSHSICPACATNAGDEIDAVRMPPPHQ